MIIIVRSFLVSLFVLSLNACVATEDPVDQSSTASDSSQSLSPSVSSSSGGISSSSLVVSSVSSSVTSSLSISAIPSSSSVLSSSSSSSVNIVFTSDEVNRGRGIYANKCANCHGDEGQGAIGFPSLFSGQCRTCDNAELLIRIIDATMPKGAGSNGPDDCTGNCARRVAAYIFEELRSPPEVACSSGFEPGEHKPIRRLNKREYIRTVSDLFEVRRADVNDLLDDVARPFDTIAEGLVVTDSHVEVFQRTAQKVAQRVANNITSPTSSTPDPVTGCQNLNRACANRYIAEKGLQVFRRPMTRQETTDIRAAFQAGNETGFKKGIQFAIEAFLQHPSFLYLTELGDGNDLGGGVYRLTSWEIASKLSYAILGKGPDQTLLDLAQQDRLQDPGVIAVQADRLLDKVGTKNTLIAFFEQWLDLAELNNVVRDNSRYSGYSDTIPSLWKRELAAFIGHLVDNPSANLADVYSAEYTFVNNELADFYGVAGPSGNSFRKVDLPGRSAGLLTQGAFLATRSRSDETAPVMRGVFMLEKVFCGEFGSPPADASAMPPVNDPNATNRERTVALTQTTQDCAYCHNHINPMGFLFEGYDPVGRPQTRDNGMPIDTQNTVVGTDIDGTYSGYLEFAQGLRTSDKAMACMVRHFASFSFGKHMEERTKDECIVEKTFNRFKNSGGNIKSLIKAVIESDAFIYTKRG